jgi:anti-sigma factor RsiW
MSANADFPLEEDLVAYLDGELDAESARRIDELLASDPQVRQKLQLLDRAWQLLDELDNTPVQEGFTQSTLEMVTAAAVAEVDQTAAEAPRRRRRRWAMLGGGLAIAGLAGFLAGALAIRARDPNQELVRELPVLENLDQYAVVPDVDFLRMLQRERVFDEEQDGD